MASLPASAQLVRVGYGPTFAVFGALVVWLASRGAHLALVLTLVTAVATSFVGERTEPPWV